MSLSIDNNNNNISNIDLQLNKLQIALDRTSKITATAADSGTPAKGAGKSRAIMSKDTFRAHKTVFTRERLINKLTENMSNLTEQKAISLLVKLGFTPEQIQAYKKQSNNNLNPGVNSGNGAQKRQLMNYFMTIGKFLQAGVESRESVQIGRLSQIKAQQAKMNAVNIALEGAAAQAKASESKAESKSGGMPWWGWVLIAVAVVILVVVTVVTCGSDLPALTAAAPEIVGETIVESTVETTVETTVEETVTSSVEETAADTAGDTAESTGESTAETTSESTAETTSEISSETTEEGSTEGTEETTEETEQESSSKLKRALEKMVDKSKNIINRIGQNPGKFAASLAKTLGTRLVMAGMGIGGIYMLTKSSSSSSGQLKAQEALNAESTTTQYLNNIGTQANNNMQEEYSLIKNITSENQAAASQAAQAFTSMVSVDSINQNQS